MKKRNEFINREQKELVYDVYYLTGLADKEYDRITKRQMLDVIYKNIILDHEWFEGYLTSDELQTLIDFANDKEFTSKNDEFNLLILKEKYLVYYDDELRKFVIPDDIFNHIKGLKVTDEHSKRDEFYYFIKGLLFTRGEIKVDEAEKIYNKLNPQKFLLSFEQRLEECISIMTSINYDLFLISNVLSINYSLDVILHNYKPKTKYTYDDYLTIGKYGVNRNNSILNEAFNAISNKSSEKEAAIYFSTLTMYIQLEDEEEIIDSTLYYRSRLERSMNSFEEADKLYNSSVVEIPLWKYKGDPFSVIDYEEIEEMFVKERREYLKERDKYNEILIRKKAILSYEEQQIFYMLIHMLMFDVNKKYKFKKENNLYEFIDDLTQDEFIKIKDLIFKDKTIIENFQVKQKENITPQMNNYITGFKHSVSGVFLAIEYEDSKLVLYDNKTKLRYVVSGIISEIKENIPSDILPTFIETRIIPLNDRFIYDIIMKRSQLSFGKGAKNVILKEASEVKKISNIKQLFKEHEKASKVN